MHLWQLGHMTTMLLILDRLFTWQLLGPLFLILLGFLLGLGIERLLLPRVQRRGHLTRWGGDGVLFKSLTGMPLFWATFAGIYLAIRLASIDSDTRSTLLRLLLVPFVISLTIFAMRLGVGAIDFVNSERDSSMRTVSLSRSLVQVAVLLLGTLFLLQSLGIAISPIIAALGIGGLAASLALQETFSNAFSGLYIIFSRQTQPGDYVWLKVDERSHVEGYITDITWRSTKIRAMPLRMVRDSEPSIIIIPNSRMASDIVIIHNRTFSEQEVVVDVSIGTGTDLEQVEQLAIHEATIALAEILGHQPDPPPALRYRTFTPERIDLAVVVYGDETMDEHQVRHEVLKRIYRRFNRLGLTAVHTEDTLQGHAARAPAHQAHPPAAETDE